MDAMETKWEDVIIARVCREHGALSSAKEKDFIKNWQVTSSFLCFAQHADASSDSVAGKEDYSTFYLCLCYLGHRGSLEYKIYVYKVHNYIVPVFCFNPW